MLEIKAINVGIGGPLAALGTGLSGFSKTLPFKALCPLYGLLAVPLILLFPIALPLYLLKLSAAQKLKECSYEKELYDFCVQQEAQALNSLKESEDIPPEEALEGISKEDVARASAHAQDIEQQILYEKEQQALLDKMVGQEMSVFKLKDFIKAHRALLVVMTVIYYVALVLIFMLSSHFIDEAMARYVIAAQQSQVLQIATAEQLAYSNSVVNIITCAGAAVILLLCLSFALVFAMALKFQVHSAQVHSYLKLAFSAILKNLPGLGVLCAMLYALFIIIERYYSHLRMIALEAIVLGQDYFDPSLAFMALRCYVIYAFALSFALVLLMSLHLLPLSHQQERVYVR